MLEAPATGMSRLGDFFLIRPAAWRSLAHPEVSDAARRAARGGDDDDAPPSIAEFVRQWALRRLVDAYGYPDAWLAERLTIDGPLAALTNASGRPFLLLEACPLGAAQGALDDAERRLHAALASTPSATLGLVTDGRRTRILRRRIGPDDFEYIPDLPAFDRELATRSPLGRDPGDLQPLSPTYERLLFELHSTMRDVDGLHDDEALDELAKVLYAKIFDERASLAAGDGAALRFQVAGASSPAEAASSLRALYEDARERAGDERSRGVFKAPLRLSDAALFRVTERLQGFSLVDSQTDLKGRAFQRVLAPAIRAGMGQFFTPDPIVELAVEIIQPRASERILDPFCGSGHFLTRCSSYVRAHQGEGARPELHGIEKSERMVRIATTDALLLGDGHARIRNTDALLSLENYPELLALAGEGAAEPALFDVVVTNPPFGSVLRPEALGAIGRFELARGRRSLPLEVLGLERSLQFLRPGGRLAIVLPEGILKNKNMRFVRRWLEGVAELKAIITLPEDAFAPFGAMVRTCLVVLRKVEAGAAPTADARCLLAELDNLGYDATGRPRPGGEVASAAAAFHAEVGW